LQFLHNNLDKQPGNKHFDIHLTLHTHPTQLLSSTWRACLGKLCVRTRGKYPKKSRVPSSPA